MNQEKEKSEKENEENIIIFSQPKDFLDTHLLLVLSPTWQEGWEESVDAFQMHYLQYEKKDSWEKVCERMGRKTEEMRRYLRYFPEMIKEVFTSIHLRKTNQRQKSPSTNNFIILRQKPPFSILLIVFQFLLHKNLTSPDTIRSDRPCEKMDKWLIK